MVCIDTPSSLMRRAQAGVSGVLRNSLFLIMVYVYEDSQWLNQEIINQERGVA